MEITYGEMTVGIKEIYRDELLVETSVDTAERGGAERVLSLEADVRLVSAELMQGEAEVAGKVNYRLLYLDKQGRLCGLDYFKEMKCRVRGEKIAASGKCDVTFLVPDAEATLSGDEITLSAVVEIALSYFGEEERRTVASVEGAETLPVQIKSQRVEKIEKTLSLDKVADVGIGVKKIVLFRADALPVSVKSDGAGVTISGEVKGTILYLNEADEVVELTLSLPYTEMGSGEAVEYAATVKNARVVLTDDEEGNAVEVEATVTLTEIIYREEVQDAIAAAFAESCRIEETRECLAVSRFVGRGRYDEDLGGTIGTEGEMEISFVRPGCNAIADVTVGDGEIKVEGVAAFRIVGMFGADYRSVQGELPFVYVLPFAEAKPGMKAKVALSVFDAAGTSRGKDVTISAKVCIEVCLSEEVRCDYLSEAKEGAAIPESDAGISVYFAEAGENLWSIARNMGVLPSALVKANPFLAEPLSEKKRVLIFRGK